MATVIIYGRGNDGGGGPSAPPAVPTSSNKGMPALPTTADGDLACATPVAQTPIGYVAVTVNGVAYEPLGLSSACYFSSDGGVTAHAPDAVPAGARLYWNGSVANPTTPWQLTGDDVVSFDYLVAQ